MEVFRLTIGDYIYEVIFSEEYIFIIDTIDKEEIFELLSDSEQTKELIIAALRKKESLTYTIEKKKSIIIMTIKHAYFQPRELVFTMRKDAKDNKVSQKIQITPVIQSAKYYKLPSFKGSCQRMSNFLTNKKGYYYNLIEDMLTKKIVEKENTAHFLYEDIKYEYDASMSYYERNVLFCIYHTKNAPCRMRTILKTHFDLNGLLCKYHDDDCKCIAKNKLDEFFNEQCTDKMCQVQEITLKNPLILLNNNSDKKSSIIDEIEYYFNNHVYSRYLRKYFEILLNMLSFEGVHCIEFPSYLNNFVKCIEDKNVQYKYEFKQCCIVDDVYYDYETTKPLKIDNVLYASKLTQIAELKNIPLQVMFQLIVTKTLIS